MAQPDLWDLLSAQHEELAGLSAQAQARALKITRAKLAEVQKKLAQMRHGSWGEAERQATLAQLQSWVGTLTTAQAGALAQGLPASAARGIRSVAQTLQTLDRAYLGSARPLRVDTLAWITDNSVKVARVRLREFPRSWNRYGAKAVEAVEAEIAKVTMVGESWTVARPAVAKAVERAVGGQQWMVDRIIRTEVAAAYNGARVEALAAEDRDPRDRMQKKLMATFDKRTGRDSIILHGQTVGVREPFTDVSGREYQAPPNRPHDREIVIPWRPSYGADFAGGSRGYDRSATTERGKSTTQLRRQTIQGAVQDVDRQIRAARMAMLGADPGTLAALQAKVRAVEAQRRFLQRRLAEV